jgi:hypothetical protein
MYLVEDLLLNGTACRAANIELGSLSPVSLPQGLLPNLGSFFLFLSLVLSFDWKCEGIE